MSSKDEKTEDFDELKKNIKSIQDALFTSDNGMSKDFADKNSDTVFKTNKIVSTVLQQYGSGGMDGSSIDSINKLSSLVQRSIRNSPSTEVNETVKPDDSSYGLREITPFGNIDTAEQEIISNASLDFQSYLNTTIEYKQAVDIIPDVKRAILNIVRDILNISDLTGKVFNNVYSDVDNTLSIDKDTVAVINKFNNLIKEKIIDRNKLEERSKQWVYESLVAGVKPIACIPYDHILQQLDKFNKDNNVELKNNISKIGESFKSNNDLDELSSESYNELFYDKIFENSLKENIKDHNEMCKSGESSVDLVYETMMDDEILDNDIIDEFITSYESFFEKEYNVVKNKYNNYEKERAIESISGRSRSTENEDASVIDTMYSSYKNKRANIEKMSLNEKRTDAKKGLKQLIEVIDSNISVVKPEYSMSYVGKKITDEKNRYSKFYNIGTDYKMPECINKLVVDNDNGVVKSKDENMTFDSDPSFGRECLIVPYKSESVLPICINGEYVGFYAIEYDNLSGAKTRNQSKNGSFTSFSKNLGFGNDANLAGGGISRSFGANEPLENTLYSPFGLYNPNVSQYFYGGTSNDDRRFDTMKKIVLKILSRRLRDPLLAENKVFKDTVIHLLRNDMLVKKRVQFTFIPPEYMIYMTYKTDDFGIPVSILDGALTFMYIYISSILSSAMIKLIKSSDKEKYEVNVGLQKNLGYTVEELQRTLSTRTLYSGSMFSSLSSVIKNSGSYHRLIVPVINGEKVYDVNQMERVNNLDPDDSFTDKIKQSILSIVYINAGSSGEFDSVDFAKQLSMRNLEYRTNIIEGQTKYSKHFTRMFKILSYFSDINSDGDVVDKPKSEQDKQKDSLNFDFINCKLAPPTYLSMTNLIDVMNTAKDLANGLAELFDLQGGNEIENKAASIFKRKIAKKYITIVEFDELESIYNSSFEEAVTQVSDKIKIAKIDENVSNDTPTEDDSSNDTDNNLDSGSGTDDMGDIGGLGL